MKVENGESHWVQMWTHLLDKNCATSSFVAFTNFFSTTLKGYLGKDVLRISKEIHHFLRPKERSLTWVLTTIGEMTLCTIIVPSSGFMGPM